MGWHLEITAIISTSLTTVIPFPYSLSHYYAKSCLSRIPGPLQVFSLHLFTMLAGTILFLTCTCLLKSLSVAPITCRWSPNSKISHTRPAMIWPLLTLPLSFATQPSNPSCISCNSMETCLLAIVHVIPSTWNTFSPSPTNSSFRNDLQALLLNPSSPPFCL